MSGFIVHIEKIWPYINSPLFLAAFGAFLYLFGKLSTYYDPRKDSKDVYIYGTVFTLGNIGFIILFSVIIGYIIESIIINTHTFIVIVQIMILLIQSSILLFILYLWNINYIFNVRKLEKLVVKISKTKIKTNKNIKQVIKKFDINQEQILKNSIALVKNYLVPFILSTISGSLFVGLINTYNNTILSSFLIIISFILFFSSLIAYSLYISASKIKQPYLKVYMTNKKRFEGYLINETNEYIEILSDDSMKSWRLYNNQIKYIEIFTFLPHAQQKYEKIMKGASK